MMLNVTIINKRTPNAIVIRDDFRYTARTRRKNMKDVPVDVIADQKAAFQKSALQTCRAGIDGTAETSVYFHEMLIFVRGNHT